MGTWGTALYSNDTSCDVRDMCNEVYPLVGIEKGTQLILEEYADIVSSDIIDNDYADFWYALADWQWKHGILTDEIKNKTISLLKEHTGIDEWEGSDIKKRLTVMDKLLDQLNTPQPEIKIPKPKIAKPKHKPGDIIIVRTCNKDYEYAETVYNIKLCGYTFLYKPEVADIIVDKLSPPYEAYNKYFAILCVGTEKTLHSQYVSNIFDEYSVYVFYDYIGDEKPTLNQLEQCGFLPSIVTYSHDNESDIATIEWRYKFMLYCYGFKIGKYSCEQSIDKISSISESQRFEDLFAMKNYSEEVSGALDLFQAFSSFFQEKVRLTLAGVNYDNLLDLNIVTDYELDESKTMLNAAALTYVAALVTTLLQILRLALIVARKSDD
jgi:hypothetical protein